VQVVDNHDNNEPLDDFGLIRAMGLTLARHYGHPQDIEWAIDDSGELYMTQTRPITKYRCSIKGAWASGTSESIALYTPRYFILIFDMTCH